MAASSSSYITDMALSSSVIRLPVLLKGGGWTNWHLSSGKAHRVYDKNKAELEKERSDEDFIALFRQFPQFDEFDDSFVENEEEWTAMVAHYVDEHLDNFVHVVE